MNKVFSALIHKLYTFLLTASVIILCVTFMIITKPQSERPNSLILLMCGLILPSVLTIYGITLKNKKVLVIGSSSLILMFPFTLLIIFMANFSLF